MHAMMHKKKMETKAISNRFHMVLPLRRGFEVIEFQLIQLENPLLDVAHFAKFLSDFEEFAGFVEVEFLQNSGALFGRHGDSSDEQVETVLADVGQEMFQKLRCDIVVNASVSHIDD